MVGTSAAEKLERSGHGAGSMSSSETSTVMACNSLRAWIEIELVDEGGNPVGGEPYWLRLSDGMVIEGTLDSKGFARHDQIPEGMGLVRFPARDWREFQSHTFPERSAPTANLAGTTMVEKAWLEIELVDEEGKAVPLEAYWIRDAGGGIHEGRLNEKGWVRLEGVPAEKCIVRFPGLDAREFTGAVEHRDTPTLED